MGEGRVVPSFIELFLIPKLVSHAPTGFNLIHEVKYDDYRMQVRIDRDVRICSCSLLVS